MVSAYLSNPFGIILAIAIFVGVIYVCYRFAKDDGEWPVLHESRRVITERHKNILKARIAAFANSIRL